MGASTIRRTARTEAYAAAHAGTPEVREVLANGQRYGHRFTPFQWLVLGRAYCDGLSDHRIARQVGADPSNVRRAREEAERLAWELVHEWAPALRKHHRIRSGNPHGEELTAEERRVLERHRKRKAGRWAP